MQLNKEIKPNQSRAVSTWSTAGLNSEFSFSLTACSTMDKEPSVPYYLPIARERRAEVRVVWNLWEIDLRDKEIFRF